jgi:hypothetical protein
MGKGLGVDGKVELVARHMVKGVNENFVGVFGMGEGCGGGGE